MIVENKNPADNFFFVIDLTSKLNNFIINWATF